MKIAVTGSSGLIGTALLKALRADGHEVHTLVRRTPRTSDEHRWDPAHRQVPADLVAEVDAVVNLAGVGIGDKRWTSSYKEQVLSSRVDSTTTISEAMAAAATADPSRARVLLSASAVGYYGDTGADPVEEDTPAGDGFLAEVCQAWEGATAVAETAGVRVAHLRTGLVLARGGLLAKLAPLVKLGFGGKLGSGQQYWPWISLRDEVDAIRFLLEHPVEGPVNLTGPLPVTNAEFTAALGQVLHRPTVLAVPGFALQIALGAFAQEGVLAGQRAVPSVLTSAGFRHTHGDVVTALRAALA